MVVQQNPKLADSSIARMVLPVGRSPLAIAAGYLGLFAICPYLAPIALIVGILAICDIKAHPEKHGLGRAWFGAIMGGVFTVILLIVLIS